MTLQLLPVHSREPVIRPLHEDDLAQIAAAESQIFDPLHYQHFALRQLMDLHGDYLLVAVADSELLGFSFCPPSSDGRTAWLLGWAVLPPNRGRGLGEKLLAHSVDRLHGTGVRAVRLTVAPANTTVIKRYRSLGFHVEYERADYFGPGLDRIIMVRQLT